MLKTLIVYIMIYSCTIYCAYRAKLISQKKDATIDSTSIFYVGIVLYSLIVGLRWNVGIDYPSYYNLLMGYNKEDILLDRLEFFNRISISFIKDNYLPFYTWFILMAGIQMYFVQKTFNKNLKIFVAWGVFFYLASQLALSMNIIRQASAVAIILYAYTFLVNKEYKYYFIWVAIASLFHTSALVGIPIYLLSKLKVSINRLLQIVILIAFFVFGESLFNYIIDLLMGYSSSFVYLMKLEDIYSSDLSIQKGLGLGILFYYIRYFVLIIYSKQLSKEYSHLGFDVFYTISFIGMCTYSTTMNNMVLSRIMMYFTICTIVCLSMLMVYLYKKSQNQVNFLLLVGLTVLEVILTSYAVLSGKPWAFVWDAPKINFFN